MIGDAPSHYSKSPALWNAAFAHLAMKAIYLPFDVDAVHLRDFVYALRDSDRFMGINVTVPHKVRIMDFLDELDAGAGRVQAVNTVVRTSAGRLIGHNTDGEGFVQSILTLQPGRKEAFIKSLARNRRLAFGRRRLSACGCVSLIRSHGERNACHQQPNLGTCGLPRRGASEDGAQRNGDWRG